MNKYGSVASGKHLAFFSQLSEKIGKAKKEN